MKATFRHTESVTDGVTLRVTLCRFPIAGNCVTPDNGRADTTGRATETDTRKWQKRYTLAFSPIE